MKIPEALAFAKKIATNFIGRPLDFISELRKSPDTQRASHFFETGFSRYKTGTLKKESALGEVLSIVAPGAHGSLASDAQLREKHCNLLAECVRVEQSSGVGSNNRPKTEATIEGIATLSAYLGQLNAGKAPATPAASAPKPAPAPAPAASKPAVVPNAASIGRAVVELANSSNPKVSGPIQQGLKQSLAAAAEKSPCFDFLPNWARVPFKSEFKERGGLCPKNMRAFKRLRAEFCMANKMTPEAAFGEPDAPMPQEVIESPKEKAARESAAARTDAMYQEKVNAVNVKIIESHKAGKDLSNLLKEKASWQGQWDVAKSKFVPPTE